MWINSSAISLKGNNWLSAIRSFVFIAIGFSIPLSTAAISITFILLLFLWLLDRNYLAKWNMIRQSPVYLAIIAFFVLHLLGLLWLEAPEPINGFKSWMVYLIPVWATAVDAKTARRGVFAFLLAMLISHFWVYLNIFQNWDAYVELKSLDYLQPLVEGRFYISGSRVTYNPLLAFAIAILFVSLMAGFYTGWRQVVAIGLLVAMTINMFMTDGRSGQLAFVLVVSVLAIHFFWKRWKMLGAMFGVLLVTISLASSFSPVFKDRLLQMKTGLSHVQEQRESPTQTNKIKGSVEQRLHFIETSLKAIKDKPWLGYGTGSYEYAWGKQVEKNPSGIMPRSTNPHNHHVLILVQFGLLGFLVYASIYGVQLWQVRTMPASYEFRSLALLLPLFYLLINNFDSSLWSHQMQALFAYITAIIYRRDMWEKV